MLRLPRFKYLRPRTAREAARMSADLGPKAMFVAGGTDLFPKLKRRQFEIEALIALDFLPREVSNGSTECVVGAGVTLATIVSASRTAITSTYVLGSVDRVSKRKVRRSESWNFLNVSSDVMMYPSAIELAML